MSGQQFNFIVLFIYFDSHSKICAFFHSIDSVKLFHFKFTFSILSMRRPYNSFSLWLLLLSSWSLSSSSLKILKIEMTNIPYVLVVYFLFFLSPAIFVFTDFFFSLFLRFQYKHIIDEVRWGTRRRYALNKNIHTHTKLIFLLFYTIWFYFFFFFCVIQRTNCYRLFRPNEKTETNKKKNRPHRRRLRLWTK